MISNSGACSSRSWTCRGHRYWALMPRKKEKAREKYVDSKNYGICMYYIKLSVVFTWLILSIYFTIYLIFATIYDTHNIFWYYL